MNCPNYWLSAKRVNQANSFVPVRPDDSLSEAYVKKLQSDLDIFCPVTSTGFRCSDIDSLQSCHDTVVFNQLVGRMQPVMSAQSFDTSYMSDDDIAVNVIPKDVTLNDVHELASALDTSLKQPVKADDVVPPVIDTSVSDNAVVDK